MDIDPVEPNLPASQVHVGVGNWEPLAGGFLAGPQMTIPLLLWVARSEGKL